MSKSLRRILPLTLLLSLAAALALVSSLPVPTAAAPGPMQVASSITTFSTTATSTYTSLSSSFTSTTIVTVTLAATTSTSYTGTLTTGVTSLIVVTATTTPVLTATTTSTSTTSIVSFPSSNPSCGMAVAAAGSALEPYANSLRGFRNNQILKTSSGQAFMLVFNSWYYSWAPYVARVAAENQVFADVLRVGLVPLFGILYAARYIYSAAAIVSPEAGAIAAGIVAASLIGAVYVAPITYAVVRVLRLRKHLIALDRLHATHLAPWVVGTAVSVCAAYVLGSFTLMELATASLTLSMLTLGGIVGVRVLASIKPSTINYRREFIEKAPHSWSPGLENGTLKIKFSNWIAKSLG